MKTSYIITLLGVLAALSLAGANTIAGHASEWVIPDNYEGPLPGNLTPNNVYDAIFGQTVYSVQSNTSQEPNVIRAVQPISGILFPMSYDAYNIQYTIAICVDIIWAPGNQRLAIGIMNTTINYAYVIGIDGGSYSGWCPSTQGFDQFVVINFHPENIYIAYNGNLTKIYW